MQEDISLLVHYIFLYYSHSLQNVTTWPMQPREEADPDIRLLKKIQEYTTKMK